MKITSEEFSRGFDRGNYANAYETQNWSTFVGGLSPNRTMAYIDGALLGFFSSYEISEIGDEALATEVQVLRKMYGKE